MADLSPGDVFEAPYPFLRETYWAPPDSPEDPGGEVASWRPGTRQEERGGGYWEPETVSLCDAVGRIVLTVISIHKPGKFAARVFFTRKWRDPDGRLFGKNGCRCTTVAAFRRLARGYRHPYQIEPLEKAA